MTNYKHNINEIKKQARGLWLDIIPAIDGRFSAAANAPGVHVSCPIHKGTDGFRFFHNGADDGMGVCNSCHGNKPLDGVGLIMWATGWNLPETLEAIINLLENGDFQPAQVSDASYNKEAKPASAEGKAKAARRQWAKATPEPHEQARIYFESRGLSAVPVSPSIKYHPGIPFQFKNKGLLRDGPVNWLTWPAILCAIRNASGIVGFHQTYLTRNGGKADKEIQQAITERFGPDAAGKTDCRRFLNPYPLPGGAVRFGPAGSVLGVGEGIETMLAVQQMTGSTSLAACCTGSLLAKVDIPPHVEKVIIFADNDRNRAGLNAAEALKARLENQAGAVPEVEILLPDMEIPENQKGVDWLDYLNNCETKTNNLNAMSFLM